MLINWEVFFWAVNTQRGTYADTHFHAAIYRCRLHKLFFFSFLLTTGCSHFVSIKQSEAVTDQIIFTHTYIAPLLLLGNRRVA